jgi:hypothetical protein
MKKIIYGFTFAIIASGATLVACNKQEVKLPTKHSESIQNTEKSLSDAQLISIINGLDPNYTKIEEIEEVLFDNCKLSSTVLRSLIDKSKFPDYIIEEMMILSAPISSSDLTYLQSVRPTLSSTTITKAASTDITNSEFSIVNLNPRQIFVAKGLTQKSLCTNGCGESEWKGTDFQILTLTSTTTPLDPTEMVSCDAGKWVCGKTVESRIVLNEGSTTIVVTKCEGTEERCVRKVSKTK